jgi:hypothetical protein
MALWHANLRSGIGLHAANLVDSAHWIACLVDGARFFAFALGSLCGLALVFLSLHARSQEVWHKVLLRHGVQLKKL